MNILRGVRVPDSSPALFFQDQRCLVLSDLHIGYESALKEKGVFLPQASYRHMKGVIEGLIESTRPESIVFLGDLKHEFGKASPQEWVEVQDLLATLLAKGLKVHVVRGNHDNYILSILRRFDVSLHEPAMMLGDYIFTHGHIKVDVPKGTKAIIIGHEHPAVSSLDLSGARYKFKCFLIGKHRGTRLVVMPALSPLSSGVGINETSKKGLLSPILREADVESFTPIVVEEGIGVFRFPQIGLMRSMEVTSRPR
jgi:putative SbcD/Mre11-related phosphoesterase